MGFNGFDAIPLFGTSCRSTGFIGLDVTLKVLMELKSDHKFEAIRYIYLLKFSFQLNRCP